MERAGGSRLGSISPVLPLRTSVIVTFLTSISLSLEEEDYYYLPEYL